MPNTIDRTAATANILTTRNGRNIFSHGDAAARRDVASIRGVILHQTAFASGSEERMDSIIANYAVMQDGRILLLRDPSMQLNSIGTNQHCVDIEFVGNYPSAREIRRAHGAVLPGPPQIQVAAGRELLQHLRSTMGLSRVHAHVQFTQKNCSGPQLWYNIGEWATSQLGMSAVGGRPIPDDWRTESLAI